MSLKLYSIAARSALSKCKSEKDIESFIKRVEASTKLTKEEKEDLLGFWVDNKRRLIFFDELP